MQMPAEELLKMCGKGFLCLLLAAPCHPIQEDNCLIPLCPRKSQEIFPGTLNPSPETAFQSNSICPQKSAYFCHHETRTMQTKNQQEGLVLKSAHRYTGKAVSLWIKKKKFTHI